MQHVGAHSDMANLRHMLLGVNGKKNTGEKTGKMICGAQKHLSEQTLLKPQWIFCRDMYIATDPPRTPQSGGGNRRRNRE